MSDGLKPCPFCGGEAEYIDDTQVGLTTFVGMGCVKCSACGRNDGFVYRVKDTAIEAWNTRAAPNVKPLVWEFVGDGYESGLYWIAQNDGDSEAFWSWGFCDDVLGECADPELCMSSAQARHERNTISALE